MLDFRVDDNSLVHDFIFDNITRNWSWKPGRRSGRVGRVPRKIRELVAELEQAGFVVVSGGKGSHGKFRHPKLRGAVILSGQSGDDAHQYQERQVRDAVRKARQ